MDEESLRINLEELVISDYNNASPDVNISRRGGSKLKMEFDND